jgi:hypothetical protein
VRSVDSSASIGTKSFLKRTRICAPSAAWPVGEIESIQSGIATLGGADTGGSGVDRVGWLPPLVAVVRDVHPRCGEADDAARIMSVAVTSARRPHGTLRARDGDSL